MKRPLVLLLVGTTASGKHRTAMEIAPLLESEIVSLDSMKIYRGMDIGTAKPSEHARQTVPHHLLDIVAPYQRFSVGDYLDHAVEAVQGILQRGRTALFVGGTGLYLRALTQGLFEAPPRDETLRSRLRESGSSIDLHNRLLEVDPERARQLHPNDTQRIIRALEIYELTGEPMSGLHRHSPHHRLTTPHRIFSLEREPADTASRIDRRTSELFQRGFVEEVRHLYRDPSRIPSLQAQRAVGYQEVLAHLDGVTSLPECIEAVNRSTRRLARKQRTWFRDWPGAEIVRLQAYDDLPETSRHIVRRFEEDEPTDQ